MFVLSLTDPVWVRSYVSEMDLGRVRPGMEVSIKIDTPGAPLFKPLRLRPRFQDLVHRMGLP